MQRRDSGVYQYGAMAESQSHPNEANAIVETVEIKKKKNRAEFFFH